MRAAAPAALAALVSLGAGATYRTGPPPGHTGAFGEPDCAACHFDAVRGDPAGSATVDAPGLYRPGEAYRLTVTVRHARLGAAGFQLSARFTDGEAAGRQAGALEPTGPETRAETWKNGVVYASHTEAGADPAAQDGGVRRWALTWVAPETGGPVAFDLAANAANDDASEFGDRIYRTRHTAHPAPGHATPPGGR